MNTNELIQLIEKVKAMGYGHIDITHEGTHLMLDEKSLAGTTLVANQSIQQAETPVKVASIETVASEQSTISVIDEPKPAVSDENTVTIDSPIVGTFYEAANPDDAPYVKVGDQIKKCDTVCIIEAMKLMNEIESEVDGEVVEVLVSNEKGVEYGQPLFKVKLN